MAKGMQVIYAERNDSAEQLRQHSSRTVMEEKDRHTFDDLENIPKDKRLEVLLERIKRKEHRDFLLLRLILLWEEKYEGSQERADVGDYGELEYAAELLNTVQEFSEEGQKLLNEYMVEVNKMLN